MTNRELDAFAILGVAPDATTDELKAAYRRRARELHPDAGGAEDSFIRLTRAFEVAVAAQAVPLQPATVSAPVPAQRRPATEPPRQRTAAAARPAGPARPMRPLDPVHRLLTVPQRMPYDWSTPALEAWALTLVPAARAHLGAAVEIALAAGAATGPQLEAATAHALLTFTLQSLHGPRVMAVAQDIPAAYDLLEADLPATVVAALPQPVGPKSRRRWF